LIWNAIKFTDIWWKIILKATQNWNKVKFEIIDNWIWIPKDKLKFIFNKFMQVETTMQRQNTSWLGVWLALVKNYIGDFDSKIEVESEVGKWSNFSFELKFVN
jgi:K+-sensing histidine kinase KdpD